MRDAMSGLSGLSGYSLRTLALLEARVRLRRLSTLATLLVVVALSWLMISDPAGGYSLMTVHGARVRYTSSALALGSALQASLLFALAGFYLLRGRMGEDLRSGLGGVIGASQASGALCVLGRWCGGVLYLCALIGAFMATVLVCHAVRGEGPIEVLVYLQTYVLVLGPMALFTASCAMLFDSWAPLMGKRGDLLYFFVWIGQMSMLPAVTEGMGAAPSAIPVDFSGMSAIIAALSAHLDIHHITVGFGEFERARAPITLPTRMWSGTLAASRCFTALLAGLPLLLAVRLFHRYSPDRVKPARSRARRSPLAMLNGWLRPLARLARPLFSLAARLPGIAGQALADVALTLVSAPAAIALLLLAQVLALALDLHALAPLALACVACWGVLVSDLPARDLDAGCVALGAAVPGGGARRYWRQLLATFILGLMFTGVAMLRLGGAEPVRAAALLAGVFALAALAALLGRTSGTGRTFLVLFLLGLYMGVQINKVALADVVGFHGSATPASVLAWLGVGMAAAFGGHAWNRRQRMPQ
jgi:hypothetical protein